MPRILCYLHSFEPGGVERTALRLCEAWAASGADVAVAIGRDRGQERSHAPALRYLRLPDPGFSTAAFETLWMILWLPFVILRQRPDVLFCAGNSYTIVAVAMRWLLGQRCPPVVAKISNDLARPDLPAPVRPLYAAWCRIQGRHIDVMVALSPPMARQVAALTGRPVGDIVVLANPVLSDQRIAAMDRHPGAADRRGRLFLAAGRLARQKDYPTMVRAFARGARSDDRLLILGDGPERQRVARLVRRLGLADRVTLPGHCARVEERIADADALLLSSRYEGLPGIVVEAMAAGLPVIATRCCASIDALVGDDGAGTLVAPGDVDALATAIARFLGPGARHDGIARARQHRVEAVAPAYVAMFDGLRAAARRPRPPLFVRASRRPA